MRSALEVLEEFNSEVWKGEHPPLVLGWSDDQLAPVVGVLAGVIPDHLPGKAEGSMTSEMRLAIAAVARSVVVGFRLTGQAVRYSRRKEHYRGPKRYRRTERFYTWYFVTHAIDVLDAAGLVVCTGGVWFPGGGGRQSVARPAGELLGLLEPVIDVRERRWEQQRSETIVLRDRKDKTDLDYEETSETTRMRVQVEALNEALFQLDLYRHGKRFAIPVVRRIFNGDFDRGGRLYCFGSSFQNIPSEERLDLELLIGGVLHPMVEFDYGNLHAVMAYVEAGIELPPGDLYAIEGFNRSLVKRAFNILLNAATRNLAVAAITEELHVKNFDLWRQCGLTTRRRTECRPLAISVVEAIENKHQAIKASFGSDCGASFQRRDSEMAVQVVERVLEKTGRCPLPMHDSLLVADLDGEVLHQVMHAVASEHALPLAICQKSPQPDYSNR